MRQINSITFPTPDDMHLHVRQGDALQAVVPYTARQFARAIIMPNTTPPVRTTEDAASYRDEILAAVPKGLPFVPLMTLYLTGDTSRGDIYHAGTSGFVFGVKFYPAGATTNSQFGVSDIRTMAPVLNAIQEAGLLLLLHGEVAGQDTDVFHREDSFVSYTLPWIVDTFPDLRIVLEHITTKTSVDFVRKARPGVAATITAHHLLANRTHMLGDGIRPHYYCKPILKKEEDRIALLEAAASGNPKFFLGTDSAPHPRHGDWSKAKETGCGCAGCFTAHASLELYAEAFDSIGMIERLPDFAARFGREFYGLPLNDGTVTLTREEWLPPQELIFGENTLVPFRAEMPLKWRATRQN